MPLEKRDVATKLVNKFLFVAPEGSKHEKYRLYDDEGVLLSGTSLSRSWDTMTNGMVSQIARELHVSRRQLEEMVSCKISRADYLDLIG